MKSYHYGPLWRGVRFRAIFWVIIWIFSCVLCQRACKNCPVFRQGWFIYNDVCVCVLVRVHGCSLGVVGFYAKYRKLNSCQYEYPSAGLRVFLFMFMLFWWLNYATICPTKIIKAPVLVSATQEVRLGHAIMLLRGTKHAVQTCPGHLHHESGYNDLNSHSES